MTSRDYDTWLSEDLRKRGWREQLAYLLVHLDPRSEISLYFESIKLAANDIALARGWRKRK